MHKVFNFGLLVHFAMTAYLLAEPSLIADEHSLTGLFPETHKRLNNIFTVPYILPYVIFFFGLLLFVVIKNTIVSGFKKVYQACHRKFD